MVSKMNFDLFLTTVLKKNSPKYQLNNNFIG
jgi:hypothetical protein